MMRRSNAAKVREWTERLRRFGDSQETVAVFCASEGVSAPSFYQWKRRLASENDRAKPTSKRRTQPERSSKNANRNFTRLTVVDGVPSPTVITLPGEITIQLGTDQDTAATVVRQLLQHVGDQRLNGSESKSC
jgi:hypothetical protein